MPMIHLSCKFDQASVLRQQVNLVSELDSDLEDLVRLGKKWLVIFIAQKTQLLLFDWSNNSGAINVKMDGSVLGAKIIFLYTEIVILLKIIFRLLNYLYKLTLRKLKLWMFLWSFFLVCGYLYDMSFHRILLPWLL